MGKTEKFSEGWRCYVQSPNGFWLELHGAVWSTAVDAIQWLVEMGYEVEPPVEWRF